MLAEEFPVADERRGDGVVWEWESRAELDAALVQGLLHLESAEPRFAYFSTASTELKFEYT